MSEEQKQHRKAELIELGLSEEEANQICDFESNPVGIELWENSLVHTYGRLRAFEMLDKINNKLLGKPK